MTDPADRPAPFRVVLVDDTPDIRDLLRMALERNPAFEVVAEAANGLEAVKITRTSCPDVVLLDIAMPVMNGLEALPFIRQACPDAIVVMLSGFGAAAMTERSLALGAAGYIQKGTPLPSLVAQVQVLAAGARTPEPA
jgi:DNA-binding NarL/FixJ family response regulator